MSYLLQLRTFIETYRVGSLSRAADNIGLSQPAASAHIQMLEAAVGKPLFIRHARGVTPTASAHDLANLVGAPLDAVESGIATARARSEMLSGTVNIAGPAEFLSERYAGALQQLTQHGLHLRLHLGNQERIYQWLAGGEVELAVTASTPHDRALGFKEIAREQFVLVAAPGMALRWRGRHASAADLQALPMVAYDEELPLIRQYWQQLFQQEPGVAPAVLAADLRALCGLVKMGAGWSVLPDYLCAPSLQRGELVEIGARGPSNSLYLVWAKSALRHPRVAFSQRTLLAVDISR